MKRFLVLLLFPFAVGAATCNGHTMSTTTASFCVYEADNASRTNYPVIAHGQVFADGEIPISLFPKPVIEGTAATNWQADVKNRYADGSVKFAIISFIIPSLGANGASYITFQQAGNGNNTGFISGTANFDNFNSGNWDSRITTFAAGSTSIVISAKSVLHLQDPSGRTFGDCGNNYWLQGAVVTAVIVQDCTSTMVWDFGWPWNGTTMGSLVMGTDPHASFHPMFVLYFVPSINSVLCEMIIENDWNGKIQDQLADFSFSTDDASGTPHVRWSRTGARTFGSVTATVTNNTLPIVSTAQIVASGASFSSTDVGLGICITNTSYANPQCGTIKSVTNSTTAIMALPTEAGAWSGGSGLVAYLDLVSAATRHRKTFWSGAPPGHYRADYNFPYLMATKALPNYDLVNASINPHDGYYPVVGTSKCCDYGYDGWVGTDRGDIGGFSGLIFTYSGALEGAPMQRADLALLYNMGTCGVSNGFCSVALQQLSGLSAIGDPGSSSALDTSTVTQYDVSGGGGMWDNFGNVPFHFRESRTTATRNGFNGINTGNAFPCYYVSQFENKNATYSTTLSPASFASCLGGGDTNVADPTGPNNSTGRAPSVYAHSDLGAGQGTLGPSSVGATFGNTPGSAPYGWDVLGEGPFHWLDYAYLGYLLTGSPYFLENEYQSAAFQPNFSSGFNGIYGLYNGHYILRWMPWGMQSAARAAFIAPDGSADQAYWSAQVNSNIEFLEGGLGITGTTLTPSSSQGSFATSGTITNFNVDAANRWDLGRYNEATGNACVTTGTGSCPIITSGLHQWTQGFCDPAYSTFDQTKGSSVLQYWMYFFNIVAFGELRDMGFSQAASVHNQMEQFLEGMTLSPTGNPWYALASYETPATKGSSATCSGNGQNFPYFTRYGGSTGIYGTWLPAYGNPTTLTNQGNFSGTAPAGGITTGNFPCTDHSYSSLARSAGTFLSAYPVSETDADGTYTASATQSWLNTNVPYFGNAAAVALSSECPQAPNYSVMIKWALAGRAPSGIVVTVLSANPGSGVLVTNSPADNFSNTSVTTAGSLTFGSGTFVTLTAPATAGGNAFSSWTGCTPSGGTSCTLTVTAPVTVTANYAGAHGIPVRRVFTTAPLAMPQERK